MSAHGRWRSSPITIPAVKWASSGLEIIAKLATVLVVEPAGILKEPLTRAIGAVALPLRKFAALDMLPHRIYFCALDRLGLRILDWICGPEPPTPADELRERDQDRLRKAFPKVDIDGKHRS